MNAERTIASRGRATALGAIIALGLLALAAAVSLRGLTSVARGATPDAPDFVVSSSRDAGPGTLREAILAADRLSTRARILITAKSIAIESALPALVNPRGIAIEAAPGAGAIDAARQDGTGAVLQIDSPGSLVKGVRLTNTRSYGIVVNAPEVQLEATTVQGAKVGVLLSAAARDCTILTSVFEQNETAIMAQPGLLRASVVSSIFRGNTRAGVWLVAAPPKETRAAPSRQSPGRDWVRITDSVFDGNTVRRRRRQPAHVDPEEPLHRQPGFRPAGSGRARAARRQREYAVPQVRPFP